MSAPTSATPMIDAGRCRARSKPARATRIGTPPRPRVRPLGDVLAELVRPAPAAAELAAVPAAAVGLPVDPAPSEDPRTAAVVVRLLQAVVEVLDGVRPAAHLRRVCDDAPYDTVAASSPVPARPSDRPRSRLRGVRVCTVEPGIVETAAAVHRQGRARALAARIEHDGRGWRFTVLAFL